MIAKRALDLEARTSSSYPEPFRPRARPREKRALGLDRIGADLTVLPPGAGSSMRHWREDEDELIHVLDGERMLRTEQGEETLCAGMVVGFKAGQPNAHAFVNRGERAATCVEISNRTRHIGPVHYADEDLALQVDAEGRAAYTHEDGTPY